jgi:uncharacterized SAM-binding protein YcdF (DUF218 family)
MKRRPLHLAIAADAARPLRWRRWLLAPALVLALAGLWLAGLIWFAVTVPTEIDDPDTPTDAIVVLTGGSQRVAAGLELLATGKGKTLFISGVHAGVAVADLLRVAPPAPDWVGCCIVLGHAADSTYGNAVETANFMRSAGYGSLRLVTASYHMRRSLFELGRAMPEMRMIAHPVFPERVRAATWYLEPSNASLVIGEYDKYLGAVLRALFSLPDSGSEPAAEGGAL